jgi:hypothetical protein
MRRTLKSIVIAAVAGVVALSAGVAYVSAGETTVVKVGNLVLAFGGKISPRALPRKTLAPIAFQLSLKIASGDGSHPPVARTLKGEIDRNVALNTRGVPTCRASQLLSRTSSAAKATCKDSLIGQGFAEAEIEFPEQPPFTARGPLLLFNGGTTRSRTLLLVHVFANAPAPTAFVTFVYVTRVHDGQYGLKIESHIPEIAGGSGSLIRLGLTGQKTFAFKHEQQGYYLAQCPTGTIRAVGEFSFSTSEKLDAAVAVPCTPKG